MTRATRSELQVVKWQAVARIIPVVPLDAETLASLLEAMLKDRFASFEVLAEMAKAALAAARAVKPSGVLLTTTTGDNEGFLDLFKQQYVTLTDATARRDIVDAVCGAVSSKEDAKRVLRSQVLRSVVRVAVDGRVVPDAPGNNSEAELPLVFNAVRLLRRIVVHMCDATDDVSRAEEHVAVRLLCELVVRLMLSRVTLAFEEAARMLQTLVETPACRAEIIQCVHLRGALTKARRFAELKPSSLASDPYLVMLCEQQHEQLCPEIDELERKRGVSLAGLPTEVDAIGRKPLDEDSALQEAARCKERGNWFFRRGDFPTARAFYRHAVLALRVTQQREEQRLEALSKAEKLAKCSVGASVQVRRVGGRGYSARMSEWRNAMVADVEDDAHIEVLYDDHADAKDQGEDGQDEDEDEEEEEVVSLDRIRLRMNTKTLDAFANFQVDCFMNMGKAASGMYDHERAVEEFSSALELDGSHAGALYYRGVSFMALHDLKRAQQDLWSANQQCRKLLKSSSSLATEQKDEDEYQRLLKATKALQCQVAGAYKRLQQLHASKKKMDKKIVKEMMRYLSTIPSLQGDQ